MKYPLIGIQIKRLDDQYATAEQIAEALGRKRAGFLVDIFLRGKNKAAREDALEKFANFHKEDPQE
jgi:hypothetical protein